MIGLSLIFHLFSALCLLALSYAVLVLKKRSDFNRRLWRDFAGVGQKQVYLDWPSKFLAQLANTLQAEFYQDKASAQPSKIDPVPWLKLHQKFGIHKLVIDASHELQVSCYRSVEGVKRWQEELTGALGGSCSVQISSPTSSKE